MGVIRDRRVRRRLMALSAFIVITALLTTVPDASALRTPGCHGERATIVGSAGDDTIVGTNRRDVIAGLNGVDAILGKGGGDLICAGKGADIIDGNKGLDRINGGPGLDACFAPEGEHSLHIGCESHLPSEPPPPPPPDRSSLMPGASGSVAAGPIRGEGAAYHQPGVVICGDSTIDTGQVTAASAYTNPGYVAVRPQFWFRDESGTWRFVAYEAPWTVQKIAAGLTVRFRTLPPQNMGDVDYWFVGYQWWWWDGFSWVSYDFTWATQYFLLLWSLDASYCIDN